MQIMLQRTTLKCKVLKHITVCPGQQQQQNAARAFLLKVQKEMKKYFKHGHQ
jgi:hypothetical protein